MGSMNDKGDVNKFFEKFIEKAADQIIEVFSFIELLCTLELVKEQMSKIEEYSIEYFDKQGNLEENSMLGFKNRLTKHFNNLDCFVKRKLDKTFRGSIFGV